MLGVRVPPDLPFLNFERMALEVYKKNQGVYARVFLAGGLGALSFLASYTIYGSFIDLPELYPGAELPLVGIRLTWGALLASLFFVISGVLIGVVTTGLETGLVSLDANSKKTVEFLIGTQDELQKVSWPTRQELTGSTAVVIVSLFILGAYIFGVDWVITRVMRFIGFM